MSPVNEDFGEFGSGKPVGEESSGRFWWFKWLVLLLLISCVPFAFRGWEEFYQDIAERVSPRIQIVNPPPGLGLQAVELKIHVLDEHSGVDEVVVRSEQGREVREVYRKSYPEKMTEDTIVLTLDGREQEFVEGKVRFSIVAFDKSFWSNSTKTSVEFTVDYERPKIDVVTTQHNAVRGGVELVFYHVPGEDEAFSGVMVGSRIFPGFPASALDPAFRKSPGVYFAFFGIPLDFDESRDRVEVFAKDPTGNMSRESIYYRVRNIRRREKVERISTAFLDSRVDEVYRAWLQFETSRSGQKSSEFFPAIDPGEKQERFKIINEDFRSALDEDLRVLLSRPKAERFWRGKFVRPPGRRQPFAFGSIHGYEYEGRSLGHSIQEGLDFAAREGTPVRAANSGIIIFADTLGLYGKTVIVDHGFGLSTLYCHLGSIEHLEGTRIGFGEEIGAAGTSGLASSSGVGFQVRLFGMPVRPEEWWDKRWIADHIEQKISATKRTLGVSQPAFLQ